MMSNLRGIPPLAPVIPYGLIYILGSLGVLPALLQRGRMFIIGKYRLRQLQQLHILLHLFAN